MSGAQKHTRGAPKPGAHCRNRGGSCECGKESDQPHFSACSSCIVSSGAARELLLRTLADRPRVLRYLNYSLPPLLPDDGRLEARTAPLNVFSSLLSPCELSWTKPNSTPLCLPRLRPR